MNWIKISRLYPFGWTNNQQTPGIFTFPPSKCWDCRHKLPQTAFLNMGSGGSSSDPHAYVAAL